jgi:hypothetical protein
MRNVLHRANEGNKGRNRGTQREEQETIFPQRPRLRLGLPEAPGEGGSGRSLTAEGWSRSSVAARLWRGLGAGNACHCRPPVARPVARLWRGLRGRRGPPSLSGMNLRRPRLRSGRPQAAATEDPDTRAVAPAFRYSISFPSLPSFPLCEKSRIRFSPRFQPFSFHPSSLFPRFLPVFSFSAFQFSAFLFSLLFPLLPSA